jgi:hypothetical protein
MFKDYRKFIVSALLTLAGGVTAAVTDGTITGNEWLLIGTAVLGSLGVVTVRNGDKPAAPGSSPYREGNRPQ